MSNLLINLYKNDKTTLNINDRTKYKGNKISPLIGAQ